jgi:hypothetical protein
VPRCSLDVWEPWGVATRHSRSKSAPNRRQPPRRPHGPVIRPCPPADEHGTHRRRAVRCWRRQTDACRWGAASCRASCLSGESVSPLVPKLRLEFQSRMPDRFRSPGPPHEAELHGECVPKPGAWERGGKLTTAMRRTPNIGSPTNWRLHPRQATAALAGCISRPAGPSSRGFPSATARRCCFREEVCHEIVCVVAEPAGRCDRHGR